MKLLIEDADYAKVGLKAGEYDLDDLNAVKAANITGGQPGSHHDIEIELRLDTGMKPEPGSVGEYHFKFGVAVKRNPNYNTRNVVVFGRPEGIAGPAVGYKVHVDDRDLLAAQDPHKHARDAIEPGLRSVADELVRLLIEEAVLEVLVPGPGTKTGRTSCASPNQAAQGQFFGLPAKKTKGECDECGGSGEYKSPNTGAVSDCSKGCPKP